MDSWVYWEKTDLYYYVSSLNINTPNPDPEVLSRFKNDDQDWVVKASVMDHTLRIYFQSGKKYGYSTQPDRGEVPEDVVN